MLFNVTALLHWRVAAADGDAGAVVDVLFDADTWTAHRLVVDAEGPSGTSRVFLPISAVVRHAGEFGHLDVELDRAQVLQGVPVEGERPAGDRYQPASTLSGEASAAEPPLPWGAAVYTGALAPVAPGAEAAPMSTTAGEELRAMAETWQKAARQSSTPPPNTQSYGRLLSCRDVIGSRVEASDGDAGDVDDLAIDDHGWTIPYLIVDARRWWPGGRVLVKPGEVRTVRALDRVLSLHLSQAELRDLPPAD